MLELLIAGVAVVVLLFAYNRADESVLSQSRRAWLDENAVIILYYMALSIVVGSALLLFFGNLLGVR